MKNSIRFMEFPAKKKDEQNLVQKSFGNESKRKGEEEEKKRRKPTLILSKQRRREREREREEEKERSKATLGHPPFLPSPFEPSPRHASTHGLSPPPRHRRPSDGR
jgi:hypothetical protein